MRAKRKILYVVQGIPGSNAPTKHAFAIADLMSRCNCDVEFMLAGILDPDNQALKESYDYPFEFPNELKLGRRNVVRKYYERFTSALSIKAFKRAFERLSPDLVVYYGIESRLAEGVIRFCQSSNTPVLVDETDWFEVHFNGNIATWIVEQSRSKRVERVDGRADGIIAISPFFKEYFDEMRLRTGSPRTFFLPPLNRENDALERLDNTMHNQSRISTIFIYAGSLADGKDTIEQFLEVVKDVGEKCRTRAEAHFIGVSKDEALKLYGDLANCDNMIFYGRRAHSEVIKMLRQADFGILFREPARYAKAGFSTKFAECMSNGIPMLCNRTGGADSILENGVDGIVCEDNSRASIDAAVRFACNMDDASLAKMKMAAFEKAQTMFFQERYVKSFNNFIKQMVEKG